MNNMLIQFDVSQKFLDKLGENAAILEQGSLINVYDPTHEKFVGNVHGLTQLSYGSIASVCHTDEKTV